MLHAVVHLPNDETRSRVERALRDAGVPVASSADEASHAVRILEAGSTPAPGHGLAISVWHEPRSKRGSNPFKSGSVRHVIGAAPELAGDALATTIRHAANGAPLLIRDLLSTGAQLTSLCYTSSGSRGAVREALASFLRPHTRSGRVLQGLSTILDELFTNAIYNAPECDGVPLFRAVSRRETVESPRRVTVQFGADERQAAVSVRDEYGTLRPEAVLEGLGRCFDFGADQLEDKPGGAGVGLFMLLQSCTRLVINICPGKWTEAVAVRDLRQTGRAFAAAAPTLNLCVVGEQVDYPSRRATPRYPVLWSGQLTRGMLAAPVTLLDVSLGGAFVRVDAHNVQLNAGDAVEIEVQLPQRMHPIVVTALICRAGYSSAHQTLGYGLTFNALHEGVVDLLRTLR